MSDVGFADLGFFNQSIGINKSVNQKLQNQGIVLWVLQ